MPPEFEKLAGILYESMGSPSVKSNNIWQIYRELLHRFENLDEAVTLLEKCQAYFDLINEEVNLEPPSGTDLHGGPENPREDGSYYMGGVNNGLGLGVLFLLLVLL